MNLYYFINELLKLNNEKVFNLFFYLYLRLLSVCELDKCL